MFTLFVCACRFSHAAGCAPEAELEGLQGVFGPSTRPHHGGWDDVPLRQPRPPTSSLSPRSPGQQPESQPSTAASGAQRHPPAQPRPHAPRSILGQQPVDQALLRQHGLSGTPHLSSTPGGLARWLPGLRPSESTRDQPRSRGPPANHNAKLWREQVQLSIQLVSE